MPGAAEIRIPATTLAGLEDAGTLQPVSTVMTAATAITPCRIVRTLTGGLAASITPQSLVPAP